MMPTIDNKMAESVRESIQSLAAPLRASAESMGYPEDVVVALCTHTALSLLGVRCMLYGGSAKWQVESDVAHGEAMLAGTPSQGSFGYDFDFLKAMPTLAKVEYPDDLHIWVGDSDGYYYDFTAPLQVLAYEESAGKPWPEDTILPFYIAGKPEALALKGWIYKDEPKVQYLIQALVSKLMFVAASTRGVI
jgi:hypothetical protein